MQNNKSTIELFSIYQQPSPTSPAELVQVVADPLEAVLGIAKAVHSLSMRDRTRDYDELVADVEKMEGAYNELMSLPEGHPHAEALRSNLDDALAEWMAPDENAVRKMVAGVTTTTIEMSEHIADKALQSVAYDLQQADAGVVIEWSRAQGVVVSGEGKCAFGDVNSLNICPVALTVKGNVEVRVNRVEGSVRVEQGKLNANVIEQELNCIGPQSQCAVGIVGQIGCFKQALVEADVVRTVISAGEAACVVANEANADILATGGAVVKAGSAAGNVDVHHAGTRVSVRNTVGGSVRAFGGGELDAAWITGDAYADDRSKINCPVVHGIMTGNVATVPQHLPKDKPAPTDECLREGRRYDVEKVAQDWGFTAPESETTGYNLHDFFDAEGRYKGADDFGVEVYVGDERACAQTLEDEDEEADEGMRI